MGSLCLVKLLYKPFGMLLGVFSGFLAKRIFRTIWAALDDREPPTATSEHAPWAKALGASALQAATFSVTRDAVQRLGARGFKHLTGVWPGERDRMQS